MKNAKHVRIVQTFALIAAMPAVNVQRLAATVISAKIAPIFAMVVGTIVRNVITSAPNAIYAV